METELRVNITLDNWTKADLHEKLDQYLKERGIDVGYDAQKGTIKDAYGREHKVEFYDAEKNDLCSCKNAKCAGCNYDHFLYGHKGVSIDAYDSGCKMDIQNIASILLHERTHLDLLLPRNVIALLPCALGAKFLVDHTHGKPLSRRKFMGTLALFAASEVFSFFEENIVNGISLSRYGIAPRGYAVFDCENDKMPEANSASNECKGDAPENQSIRICVSKGKEGNAGIECYCLNATTANKENTPKTF